MPRQAPRTSRPTPRPGRYTVPVTVSDGHTTASGSGQVTIANTAPNAALSGPATAPNIGVAASFSAAGSSDPDGDPLTYSWRVDGTAVSRHRSDPVAGVRQRRGPHRDRRRQRRRRPTEDDTATVSVNVPNKLPSVDFSWSPRTVEKGDPVTFTSSSVDPDGKPLSKQEWDLDGDGQYDDAFGDTATRTYTTTGSRTIGLRVTDADGGVSVGHLVLVPGNRPPTASFTAAPTSPLVGQVVTFTSTSKDSDGKVASMAWDLNGDNVYSEGTGATASSAFTSVGTHRVGLKVTDDDGSTDLTFVSVVVKPSSGVAGASTSRA